MIYIIILFFIVLLAIILMVALQVQKLSADKIDVAYLENKRSPIKIDIYQARRTLWQLLRILVHLLIVQIIRLWAFISHFVHKKWQKWFHKKLNEGEEIEAQKKESFFLHSISEYKMKLKRIKQKLKEKEEEKL